MRCDAMQCIECGFVVWFHPFFQGLMDWLIRLFVRSLVRSFIHSFIHPSTHPFSLSSSSAVAHLGGIITVPIGSVVAGSAGDYGLSIGVIEVTGHWVVLSQPNVVIPPSYSAFMVAELPEGKTFASLGCEENSIGMADMMMEGENVRKRGGEGKMVCCMFHGLVIIVLFIECAGCSARETMRDGAQDERRIGFERYRRARRTLSRCVARSNR